MRVIYAYSLVVRSFSSTDATDKDPLETDTAPPEFASTRRRHARRMSVYRSRLGYFDQDFDEDPLLPQKALPLPDDSDANATVQSKPADVLAAAASAMVACNALPDGAAETILQPLAEAYLLAVRREAQLLPKVVSAVSSRSRKIKRYMKTATSDAFCASKMTCTSASETNAPGGITRSSNPSDVECKGLVEAKESLTCALPQNVAASPAAKTGLPARHNVEKRAVSRAVSTFGEVSFGEPPREKASCFTCPSSASSSDEKSPGNRMENPGQTKGSSADSLSDIHSSECTGKNNEARTERAGVSDEGVSCTAKFMTESTERQRELRSKCRSAYVGRAAAEPIAALEGCVQHTGPAEAVCERTEECFPRVVQGSFVGVDIVLQDGSAGGDSSRDPSSVGTVGGRLSCGTTGEETAVTVNAPATTDNSNTVHRSVQHTTTETEKAPKDSRQKVAAYVDRLVLLDKQREAASASASAPAAAWRAAALQKFKGLRSYVNSSEVLLEEHHRAGVTADCISWSEQEWQLYCRCYPPSAGVLGRCDTVTLCRLLFLLVEDIKQQNRAIAKRDKNRCSSTSSGSCGYRVRWSQTLQEGAKTKADKEQSNFTSRARAEQQRRTGEVEQVENRTSSFQVDSSKEGWEPQGDRGSGQKFSPSRWHQDSTAVTHMQGSAESDSAYSTHAEDKGGVGLAKEQPLFEAANDSSSALPGAKEQEAHEITAETEISCAGGCRCCRHRSCCVTLQQACWLFGIFIFLDELQAMDADVASCIQQLRRLCENAREQATSHRAAVQQRCTAEHLAPEDTGKASKRQEGGVLWSESENRTAVWVPTDLVAAINLLIVVINDFFNQR